MPTQIVSLVIGAIGLLIALWLGISIAEGQWIHLYLLAFVILGLIFVSGAYRYSFHLLLGIVLLDGSFNFGFAIGPTEQLLAITGALVAATFWRKSDPLPTPPILRNKYFGFAKICVGAWICYTIIHFVIHILLFQTPGMQNVIKSYNATITPYVFLFFFFVCPRYFPIPRRYSLVFGGILLAVALAATAMRAYQSLFGAHLETLNPGEAGMAAAMVVPFIRFVESVYALRGIAPAAMLFGTIALTSQAPSMRSFGIRCGSFFLILTGAAGALYSGGRATIVIGTILSAIVLLIRGKRGPVAIGLGCAILFVAAANLMSHWINTQAPMQVARTLQWILLEKDPHLSRLIGGSSDWRLNLMKFAIKEWSAEPKTILLGIGFQGISASDYAAAGFAGGNFASLSEEFAWEIGVKRVATHSMFTDLLVGYGAIGCILYYTMLFSFLLLTAHVFFRTPPSDIHRDFSLFTAGIIWTLVLLGNIAGTFLTASAILYLIILVTALYQHPSTTEVNKDLA